MGDSATIKDGASRLKDRGSSAVGTAIVFPGMLLVVILAFQFGLIAYSHHVVVSSAQAAATTAGAEGVGAGVAHGQQLLGSIAGITSSSSVGVGASSNDQVTIIASAQVMRIFPLLPAVTVRGSGSATVERFRSEGD